MRWLLLLLLAPMLAIAQDGPKSLYPQDYFRNPLDIPIFLAGNFGECRPGHFHSGIDIKTLGEENQPVHAAADGYISRIKMEPGGFGHGIYITHPNGYTTLYAHLNKFAPAIQKYVREQQYAQQRWNVDLQLSPAKFPVKKGEQIAWSGNTGASTAPHLHFEIRDGKTEHPLNPQLFGLPMVDKIAPVPAEVVFYNGAVIRNELGVVVADGGVYAGSAFTISLAKAREVYRPEKSSDTRLHIKGDTIQAPAGLIGVGINADDYMDGSTNTIAFYTAELYLDDSLQCTVTLDNIGYDETRYINAYADYKTRTLQHKWVQCLFRQPGNRLGIYSHLNRYNGYLDLMDKIPHRVRIVLTDDKGNAATTAFVVKPVEVAAPTMSGCDLFSWHKENAYRDSGVSFTLDDHQLYADICFTYTMLLDSSAISDRYRIHESYVPLHHYFELNIKPHQPLPQRLTGKVVMIYSDGKEEDGRAATATADGRYKARVRNFGTYWLEIDTIPPVIKWLQSDKTMLTHARELSFEVKDDKTSVKTFSGYIDGKWVCFEQHGSRFFYEFDSHCASGGHEVKFIAADENGNESVFRTSFRR